MTQTVMLQSENESVYILSKMSHEHREEDGVVKRDTAPEPDANHG